MLDVTVDQAKSYIASNPFVVVVWTQPYCPVCEEFEPQITGAVSDVPEWKLLRIDSDQHEKAHGLYFEPSMFPAIYLFKDGQRILERFGYAKKDDMMPALTQALAKDFKTPEQREKEQLEALDN
jgi:thioredoxin-like negative regulator of GroEL